MRAVDLIHKKRDGQELTTEEISFLIRGYSEGQIPDYQMAAWAMSVFYKGMSARETADLTIQMASSGDTIDLSSIHGIKVDKHSTGGVGDKTTIVLGPMVAAAGVPVAKMSGRGLGHTGGTIDKLEAIRGFSVELAKEQFFRQVNEIGIAVVGQSGNMTPADKKLYALRDVTATVDSIPLIASSVMSKKIAAGADAIVLDVKTGSGAFMKTLEDSIRLAKAMVEIGTQVGRQTVAVISDMDQPLGYAIGNALEIREAVDTLRGEGPADLEEVCIILASHMLLLGGKASTEEEATAMLFEHLRSGEALEKLKKMVAAQGGDTTQIDNPELLPQAELQVEVLAEHSGFIESIQAEEIGIAAMMLGAGRETKDSKIDLAAGVVLRKKIGDRVEAGEALAVLHFNPEHSEGQAEAGQRILGAYGISETKPPKRPLVFALVTKDGVKRFL